MGRQKLLLPLDGVPMARKTIITLGRAFSPLVAVLGSDAAEVEAALDGIPELLTARNAAWEEGMLGSYQTGLMALESFLVGRGPRGSGGEGSPGGCFVHHADMPFISPAILSSLCLAAAEDQDSILFPRYAGTPFGPDAGETGRLGHPVYVPWRLVPDILALGKGCRAKDFLAAGPYRVLDTFDRAILDDIDTPLAYAALCRAYGCGGEYE